MSQSPLARIALALAATVALPLAYAHTGPLDPTFGNAGMRVYSSVPSLNADIACPGPNGTLMLVYWWPGSSNNVVVTARLRADGALDTAYGNAGVFAVSVPSGSSYPQATVGACAANGTAVLAASFRTTADYNVGIIRVSTLTGDVDATFGNGGLLEVDLDQHTSGTMGQREWPQAVDVLASGAIAVTGFAEYRVGQERPFAILVRNGVLERAKVFSDGELNRASYFAELPDGSYEMAGSTSPTAGVYRAHVDATFTTATQTDFILSPNGYIETGKGLRLGDGTVVLPAKRASVRPLLAVFGPYESRLRALPTPQIDGQSAAISYGWSGFTSLMRRNDGSLLYLAPVHDPNQTNPIHHLYAVAVRIGANAAEDVLDTSFGSNGSALIRYQWPAECSTEGNFMPGIVAFNWNGNAAFAGSMRTCAGTNAIKMLVGRLALTDVIFRYGFDR